MNSQTEENYLKALYTLTSLRGEANVNEISKHLELKMPTVNSMMKRLAEKGLVVYQSYKPLKLTAKGKKQAALIIRKHRLTEMFLVKMMGFGWEEVHAIAEQIEHIQSPAFFAKMDELLNYPKVDPHGSPIPDKNGNITWSDYSRLSDCKVGQKVVFEAVQPASEELLKYLNSRSLKLGVEITIQKIEVFDGSMTVSYGTRKSEILSNQVSERLLVGNAEKS